MITRNQSPHTYPLPPPQPTHRNSHSAPAPLRPHPHHLDHLIDTAPHGPLLDRRSNRISQEHLINTTPLLPRSPSPGIGHRYRRCTDRVVTAARSPQSMANIPRAATSGKLVSSHSSYSPNHLSDLDTIANRLSNAQPLTDLNEHTFSQVGVARLHFSNVTLLSST